MIVVCSRSYRLSRAAMAVLHIRKTLCQTSLLFSAWFNFCAWSQPRQFKSQCTSVVFRRGLCWSRLSWIVTRPQDLTNETRIRHPGGNDASFQRNLLPRVTNAIYSSPFEKNHFFITFSYEILCTAAYFRLNLHIVIESLYLEISENF